MTAIEAIILLLFAVGVFFFIVGTLGLFRLPDVYTRMHATTKCDTLGAGCILSGIAIYSGLLTFTGLKMIMIIVFVFWANPTAAHAIAKAAYRSGVKLWEGSIIDEYGADIR